MAPGAIPAWAAPAAQEIRDAHRIALATAADHPRSCGRVRWRTRSHGSPVRARPPLQARSPGEVGRGAADDELMFAQMLGSGPEQLLVGDRAVAVELVLRWLLGLRDAGPPVDLPARHPDGRVFTADELFAQRIRGLPPERRSEVRATAVSDAARYAELAELAESGED